MPLTQVLFGGEPIQGESPDENGYKGWTMHVPKVFVEKYMTLYAPLT